MSFIKKLQQYQDNKSNKITMADLNKMVNQVNDQLSCDDDCQRQKKINRLRNNYYNEKERINRAPHDLDVSRKKYFTYAFGEQYYDRFMERKVKKEVTALTNKLAQDHQYNIKILKDNANDFQVLKDNNNYITILSEKYQRENEFMTKKIKEEEDEKNISDRKAVYENNELEKVETYTYQLIWLYWTLILVFALTFFLKNMYMEKKNFIILFGLIIYPFTITWVSYTLSKILKFIYNLFPKNRYLEDPDSEI